jgi:hypothetical protein
MSDLQAELVEHHGNIYRLVDRDEVQRFLGDGDRIEWPDHRTFPAPIPSDTGPRRWRFSEVLVWAKGTGAI